MTLTQNGSTYSLQQRHGNTFNFNSLGRFPDQHRGSIQPVFNLTLQRESISLPQTVTDWKTARTFTFTYSGTRFTAGFRFRRHTHRQLRLRHHLQSAGRPDLVHRRRRARPAPIIMTPTTKSPQRLTRKAGWLSAISMMVRATSPPNTRRATPTRPGKFSGRAGRPRFPKTRRAGRRIIFTMTNPG